MNIYKHNFIYSWTEKWSERIYPKLNKGNPCIDQCFLILLYTKSCYNFFSRALPFNQTSATMSCFVTSKSVKYPKEHCSKVWIIYQVTDWLAFHVPAETSESRDHQSLQPLISDSVLLSGLSLVAHYFSSAEKINNWW